MDFPKWYWNQAKLDTEKSLKNLCPCSNKSHGGHTNVPASKLPPTTSVSPSLYAWKKRYLRETDLPYECQQAGPIYCDQKRKLFNFTVPNITFSQGNISPMATPPCSMQHDRTLSRYNPKYLNVEETCEKFADANNLITSQQNTSLMITPRFYMHDVSCMHLPNCQRGKELFPTQCNKIWLANNSTICNQQLPNISSSPGQISHYPAANFQLPYIKPPYPYNTDKQYISLRQCVAKPLIDSVATKLPQISTKQTVQYQSCLQNKVQLEENKRIKKLKNSYSVSSTTNSPETTDGDQTLTFHAADIDEVSNQLQPSFSQSEARYKTDNQDFSLRHNFCVAKPLIDYVAKKLPHISTKQHEQYQKFPQKEDMSEENKNRQKQKTIFSVSTTKKSPNTEDGYQTLTFHAAEIDERSNHLTDNLTIGKRYNFNQARSLLGTADAKLPRNFTNKPEQFQPCRKKEKNSEQKEIKKKLKNCSSSGSNNINSNQTITFHAAEIEVGCNHFQPPHSKLEAPRKTDYNTFSSRHNFRQIRRLPDTAIRKIRQISIRQLIQEKPNTIKEAKHKKEKIGNKEKMKNNPYSVSNHINSGNATAEFPILSVQATETDALFNNFSLPYFLPAIKYKDIKCAASRLHNFCETRPPQDTLATKVPKFCNRQPDRNQPYRRNEKPEEAEFRKMKKTNYNSIPAKNNSRNATDAHHILPVPAAEIQVRSNNFELPYFHKPNFQSAVHYKTENHTDSRRQKFFQAKSLLDTIARKIPPISTQQHDLHLPYRKREEYPKEEREKMSKLKKLSSVSTNIIVDSPNSTGLNHNLSAHSSEIDVGSRFNTFQNFGSNIAHMSAGSTVLECTTLESNRCNYFDIPNEKTIQYQSPGAIKPSKFSMKAINAMVCQAEINSEGLAACPLCRKLGRRMNLKSHIYLCQFDG